MTTQPSYPLDEPTVVVQPKQVFDSADWHSLPLHSYLALYKDGDFAAPQTAPAQLQAIDARWITVTGNYQDCSLLDWELGNSCFTAAGLRGFVRGRRAMGSWAIPYVDRANAAEALAALHDGGTLPDYPGLYWWIPTLDGRQWTAQELAADLAANWDAPIAADRLWGNQWKPGGPFDTSNLFMGFR